MRGAPRLRRWHRRARRGVALVAALGLLLMAAGLLGGAAVASVALRRATRSLVASARADSEGTRGLGELVLGWDAALDSLPVGGWREWPLTAPPSAEPRADAQARVQRLSGALFAGSVAVRVGGSGSARAFRSLRLLVERPPRADSGVVAGVPRRITRWSVFDVQ